MAEGIGPQIVTAAAALGGVGVTSLVTWTTEARKARREDTLRFVDRRRELYVLFASTAETMRRLREPAAGSDEWKDKLLPLGIEIALLRPTMEKFMWNVVNGEGDRPITTFLNEAKKDLQTLDSSQTADPDTD
jgi:hypothetical protein